MSWRDLRNAPLIEAFLRYSSWPGATLPNGKLTKDQLFERFVWDALVKDGLDEEFTSELASWGPNGWRCATAGALFVWEDMCEIIPSDLEHLNRMIKMFPDTELAGRCEAALRFHTLVPSKLAAKACEEARARPRRFK